MAPLLRAPHGNLPSVFLASNSVPDERLVWVDGANKHQQVSKALACRLARCLADGYLSTGLVDPQATRGRSIIIFYSENQVIQFPNILSVITAGGIVATCPWQASVQELLHRVDLLHPKAIVCSEESLSRAAQARHMSSWKFEIIIQNSSRMDVWKHSSGQTLISSQEHDWDKTWNEDVANRPSFIVFSSGTIGYPKGVLISQKNIIYLVFQIRSLWSALLQGRATTPLKLAGVLDSAHVAGMVVNCFICLGLGITNYLVSGSNTGLLLRTLADEKINLVMSVPPILQRLVSHPDWHTSDLSSLQHVVVGAAKSSPELQQAVTEKMEKGAFCQQGWGMTELTFLATMPRPGVLGPWDSVGKPLDGNKIKICNEQGHEVPIGQRGEIYVAGPVVTGGYYNQSDHQRNTTFAREWLRTGDLGFLDSDGYLYITGRNKDLIKYNGAQVSPLELEEILRRHEKVSDVAVVGTELDDGNELPTAFVVLEDDNARSTSSLTQDIAEHVAKHVSPYKRLRGGVHAIEAIPKNAMGKVMYKDLRAEVQDRRSKQALKTRSNL